NELIKDVIHTRQVCFDGEVYNIIHNTGSDITFTSSLSDTTTNSSDSFNHIYPTPESTVVSDDDDDDIPPLIPLEALPLGK
ncbi:hypothetical protein FRC03_004254, partial [Tulasnella sp. 419]